MDVRKMSFWGTFSSLLVRVVDIPLQNQIINVAWRDGKHAIACCRADYLCRD